MSMKHRSKEDRFFLAIMALLLAAVLGYSTCGHAQTLVQQIRTEAIRQGVNADVAVAIARVESNLNPQALGTKGDIGLFQVMPYNSKGKNLWIVKNNIEAGIRLLRSCTMVKETLASQIVCYNNGPHRNPKYPLLHPYYRKVARALANL